MLEMTIVDCDFDGDADKILQTLQHLVLLQQLMRSLVVSCRWKTYLLCNGGLKRLEKVLTGKKFFTLNEIFFM